MPFSLDGSPRSRVAGQRILRLNTFPVAAFPAAALLLQVLAVGVKIGKAATASPDSIRKGCSVQRLARTIGAMVYPCFSTTFDWPEIGSR